MALAVNTPCTGLAKKLAIQRPVHKLSSSHLTVITMKINKLLASPIVAAVLAFGSFGVASAQVASPMVALQFGTNGLTSPLSASSTDATVARLLLDTTGSSEAVRISSLPFNLITGSGAFASTLRNCRVFNESNSSVALNTPANSMIGLSNGINNVVFNSTLVLPANTLTTVALRCDVGSDLVAGGTYTINMNTTNVVATGASTGLPASVTIRGAVVIPPVVTPPVVTPGMPTTGAAGQAAQNLAMVALSLLMAGVGFAYLSNRERQSRS